MFKFYKGMSKPMNHRKYFIYTDKLVNIIDAHAGFSDALLDLMIQVEKVVNVYVHWNLFKKDKLKNFFTGEIK